MLIARCRRGSRPAVSWCVLPCIWSYCPPLLPCPALVPMLHVLPVYARPASPRAHAVMLAAPCPAVPCLPDQRRPACAPDPEGRALLWYDHNHNAAPAALLPLLCLHVYMSTCLHVYMFTCLQIKFENGLSISKNRHTKRQTETNKDRSNKAPAFLLSAFCFSQ